ncbi:hypothetical protein M8998_05775 [Sphingobacterium sp. lm-10]|uniref:hypothetical protein n=1 Tax=Sphingobacterium sp. lm-10 TaxID=2944904 RepID=UPI0020218147|nr:hypothetical protein [Sphingobacterium sp. lm-10]MCL7987445.1 hypothetical protein [Sphingobacterium sp. lm-10]
MNKIYLLFITSLLLSACSKSESETCLTYMRNHFRDQLKCNSPHMYTNLYRGVYKGQTVYFVDIVCPACLTMPPQRGYTCEMKEVNFTNFAEEVNDVKEVYNSCTRSYSE